MLLRGALCLRRTRGAWLAAAAGRAILALVLLWLCWLCALMVAASLVVFPSEISSRRLVGVLHFRFCLVLALCMAPVSFLVVYGFIVVFLSYLGADPGALGGL